MPLALASLATAAGFFPFFRPTTSGVSELGLIAGAGMLIAFLTSMTLLPALIMLTNPPGEPEALGYAFLAPVDEYLARHRMPIIVGTLLVVACVSPALYMAQFDFNPIDLQNPDSEAISTYLELRKIPRSAPMPSRRSRPRSSEANAMAARLMKLPEVANVLSLSTFIPADQDQKIPIIGALRQTGGSVRRQGRGAAAERRRKRRCAERRRGAPDRSGAGQEARALRPSNGSRGLDEQARQGAPERRESAAKTLIWPLERRSRGFQASLEAKPVTERPICRAVWSPTG